MIKHIFMKGGRPFAGLILFFTIISSTSCDKENDEIGEIYYGNLTGKMSFRQYSSPGNDKIIIVDFDKKSTTILIPKDNARIWDVAVSIAPGGQEVVYSACNLIKGCYQLFLMSVDSGNYIQLTKPDFDLGSPNYPTWNINGTKIFYVRAGAVIGGPVYSILPDGDSNMIVANLDVHSRVCISRDEDYLLMGLKGYPDYESGGIYRYNIHSHALKQLAVAENTSYAFGPVYSPDEQKISYTVRHTPNDGGEEPYYFKIMVMNADGSEALTVIEIPWSNDFEYSYVTWSPEGTKLAFSGKIYNSNEKSDQIYVINLDGTGLMQITSGKYSYGGSYWVK